MDISNLKANKFYSPETPPINPVWAGKIDTYRTDIVFTADAWLMGMHPDQWVSYVMIVQVRGLCGVTERVNDVVQVDTHPSHRIKNLSVLGLGTYIDDLGGLYHPYYTTDIYDENSVVRSLGIKSIQCNLGRQYLDDLYGQMAELVSAYASLGADMKELEDVGIADSYALQYKAKHGSLRP